MLLHFKNSLAKYALHLGLLPFFFFIHTLNRYYHSSLITDALLLSLVYTTGGLIASVVLNIFFRNFTKSSIVVCLLLCIQFFTGSFHDGLKSRFPDFFLNKYIYLFPFLAITILIVAFLLKKRTQHPQKIQFALNSIFLLLLLTETVPLTANALKGNSIETSTLVFKEPKTKPDIYILLADEYAGHSTLKNDFGYDNSPFENELRSRGFWVGENTNSNYNATVYSMASFLNLDYLNGLERNDINHQDMLSCRNLIKHSQLTNWLINEGYSIENNSPFDIGPTEKLYKKPFFLSNWELLSFHLFSTRIYRQLGFHLHKKELEDLYYRLNNIQNDKTSQSTLKPENFSAKGPRFVYSHFSVPHHPYLKDSTGNHVDINLLKSKEWKYNKSGYLNYLLFGNKMLIQLCDSILRSSKTPPVIIVMSDHGFRQYKSPANNAAFFSNLMAVYTPDGNYTGLYPGISNVNVLRQILNNELGQHFIPLKDSSIFLTED